MSIGYSKIFINIRYAIKTLTLERHKQNLQEVFIQERNGNYKSIYVCHIYLRIARITVELKTITYN